MFNAEVIPIVPSELGELLDCHFDRLEIRVRAETTSTRNSCSPLVHLRVRYWHIADVPLALMNVCFWGNRRHRADFPPFGARNESVDARW